MITKRVKKAVLKLNFQIPYYLLKIKIYKIFKKNPYKLLKKIAYKLNKALNLDIVILGKENIPKDNFIIYSNHRGFYDPVVIFSPLNTKISFVMKSDLKERIVIKDIAELTNSRFFFRNPKDDLKTILSMCEESKEGVNYLIFPEGTRNTKETLLDFKGGSFKIPEKSHCDIYPVVLYNTEIVLDKNSNFNKIFIYFLPPIRYNEYKDMKAIQISNYIKDKMQLELDKLRKEDLDVQNK